MHASRELTLLVLATVGLGGCSPGCENLCRKLDRCELNDFVTIDECQLSCDRQLDQLDQLEDREPRRTFDAHRRCVGGATCEALAEGVCYTDDLFPFDADGG